jgi:hypothetical protein
MNIPLDTTAISNIDLGDLSQYLNWNPTAKEYFLSNAGQEHYQLIAYLSQQISGEVADVGTLFGASALALSINDKSLVYTFDIVRCIPDGNDLKTPLSRPNIKFYVAKGQAVIAKLAQCKLVILDVDPHDGNQETDIVNRLINHDFKGLLVVDDIHLNKGMKHFWDNIPTTLKKVDVTHIGHNTGTGIIIFDPSFIDVCM